MTKNELLSIIKKEIINNPQITSLELAQKYNLPYKIVEILKIISN